MRLANPGTVALLLLAMPWPLACSLTEVDGGVADRSTACARGPATRSTLLPLSVCVDRRFRDAGSQRFLLRDRVEVEQHLFVDASSQGEVRRLVWVQFERFLPAAEGGYEYEREQAVAVGDHPFVASVRQYRTPPDPDSDRSRAYAMLEARGFNMPAVATRARLVHVSKVDRRSELMIVYAERAEQVREPSDEETAALILRAVAAVRVSSR